MRVPDETMLSKDGVDEEVMHWNFSEFWPLLDLVLHLDWVKSKGSELVRVPNRTRPASVFIPVRALCVYVCVRE